MLDYPNNFDTKIFPESRNIAMSRTFALWSLITFFIITALSGIILWTANSKELSPIMISISADTGEWSAIMPAQGVHESFVTRALRRVGLLSKSGGDMREYSMEMMMQESVAGNFAKFWFTITDDKSINDAMWASCKGERNIENGKCFICCTSSDGLYNKFAKEILPDWRRRSESGETLTLASDTIIVSKASEVSNNGGMWRVDATLVSNKSADRKIVAFVSIARDFNARPMTLGFYVADFNAFVMKEGKSN